MRWNGAVIEQDQASSRMADASSRSLISPVRPYRRRSLCHLQSVHIDPEACFQGYSDCQSSQDGHLALILELVPLYGSPLLDLSCLQSFHTGDQACLPGWSGQIFGLDGHLVSILELALLL